MTADGAAWSASWVSDNLKKSLLEALEDVRTSNSSGPARGVRMLNCEYVIRVRIKIQYLKIFPDFSTSAFMCES